MAQRYENNEPEVGDSSRKEIEQLTFAFMKTKCSRELDHCKDKSNRQVLDTLKDELITARQDTIHESDVLFNSDNNRDETPNAVSPSDQDMVPPESPPAERVGVLLGELEDILEQESRALVVRTPVRAPANVPFFLSTPTHVPFAEVIERVDQAVNRIVPSQSTVSSGSVMPNGTNSEPPVPPLPPLESSTFSRIVRELIQVTEGMRMHPGQLAICLYFCYRLGVRLMSQHLANRMGLGTTMRDLMETCAQFLVEQELIPYVQEHGGWASYIEEWVQPNPSVQEHQIGISKVIGYVGVALVIGIGLGFFIRSYRH